MKRASWEDTRTVRWPFALSHPLIPSLIALAVRHWIVIQSVDSCALRHLGPGARNQAGWHSANARVWATWATEAVKRIRK